MTNIVGPHGPGVNEVTSRPDDVASGNALDTWFADCVAGVAGTGTKIPAVWLNKVAALLRRAIRGMAVADAELDDDMLLKAIQRADKGIEGLGAADSATIINLYAGLKAPDLDTHLIRKIKQGAGISLAIEAGTGELIITATGSTPTLASIAPALVAHQTRAGNAAPASLVDNTWVDRIFNFTDMNQIVGATHDGGTGVFTLPAGTYRCKWDVVGFHAGSHRTRLWNGTAGALIAPGTSNDAWGNSTSGAIGNSSSGSKRFTLAVTSAVKLQHKKNDYGSGAQGDNSDISPDSHLDGWIEFVKEG